MDRNGRRQVMLDAALQIVGEEGCGALTHRRVAERAGVSLSATTYYFKSKEDMLEQALLLSADRQLGELAVVHDRFDLDVLPLEDWAAQLAHVLAAETRGQRRTMLLAQFEMDLYAARRPPLRKAVRELNARYAGLIEPVLRQAGVGDPESGARFFVASVTGLLLEQAACPARDFARAILAPGIVRLIRSLAAV
jgi:TetR/AcrR family transcriptional regulator, regulator of biofilm formation and stress response